MNPTNKKGIKIIPDDSQTPINADFESHSLHIVRGAFQQPCAKQMKDRIMKESSKEERLLKISHQCIILYSVTSMK